MVDQTGLFQKESEKITPNTPTKCQRLNITTQSFAQAKEMVLVQAGQRPHMCWQVFTQQQCCKTPTAAVAARYLLRQMNFRNNFRNNVNATSTSGLRIPTVAVLYLLL